MTGLLGAPLQGYSPSDFGTLIPTHDESSSLSIPRAWTAQASIEVRASSDYLRRQAAYEAMLAAVDLSDSD